MESEHWITKAFGFSSALPEFAEWLKADHFTSPCLVFPFYLMGIVIITYLPHRGVVRLNSLGPEFWLDLKSTSSLTAGYLNGECSQLCKHLRGMLLMQIIVALVKSGCSSWKYGSDHLWFSEGSWRKSKIAGQRIRFWYQNIKFLRLSLLMVHISNAYFEYVLEYTGFRRIFSFLPSQDIKH